MICGAEQSTASVVTNVNVVKVIRQNLSITIAANFQSETTSFSSSDIFILFVMYLSSLRIHWSSLFDDEAWGLVVAWLWLWLWKGVELFSWRLPFTRMKQPPAPRERGLKQRLVWATLITLLPLLSLLEPCLLCGRGPYHDLAYQTILNQITPRTDQV